MPPLTDTAIAELCAVCEAAYPFEGCGVVLASGRVIAIPNRLDGTALGRRRFEMDGLSLLGALRAATADPLVSIFHSHPDGDASPSADDVAQAAPDGVPLYPGVHHLIVSVHEGRTREVRAFCVGSEGWVFDGVVIRQHC